MGRMGVRVCAWVVGMGLGAGMALAQARPTLQVSYSGFGDVNGNGVLDCGEPVDVVVGYSLNESGTPAMSGTLVAPYTGSAGLSFLAGSVVVDPDLTVGCQASVTEGNSPGDAEMQVAFSCPADPVGDNGWTVVMRYEGVYDSVQAPQFTEVAQAATSIGTLTASAVSGGAVAPGGVCPGMPNQVTVEKTAAGPGTPGSVLLYTVGVTDTSGLGDGGVSLLETVPANTVFDAAASSAGWACESAPAPAGPGTACRLAVGNVPPSGTVTRYFAVTIDTPLAAGVWEISNTACAQFGAGTAGGCGSVVTPTEGTPQLAVTKSVRHLLEPEPEGIESGTRNLSAPNPPLLGAHPLVARLAFDRKELVDECQGRVAASVASAKGRFVEVAPGVSPASVRQSLGKGKDDVEGRKPFSAIQRVQLPPGKG